MLSGDIIAALKVPHNLPKGRFCFYKRKLPEGSQFTDVQEREETSGMVGEVGLTNARECASPYRATVLNKEQQQEDNESNRHHTEPGKAAIECFGEEVELFATAGAVLALTVALCDVSIWMPLHYYLRIKVQLPLFYHDKIMYMKLLQFLGIRSRCCGAKKVFIRGWSYKQDRYVCVIHRR